MGARGGNQEARTRGRNKRREQEAGRSLRNAAFRAEPKKSCINTTFSINDKTVYKHVFPCCAASTQNKTVYKHSFLFGRRRAKWKNPVYTHFFIKKQSCVYTLFFRLRPKCDIAQASSRLLFLPLVPASYSGLLVSTSCSHQPLAWIFSEMAITRC